MLPSPTQQAEIDILRRQKKRENAYLVQQIKELEFKIRLRKREVDKVSKN